jgi:hypothetical protein
MAGQKRSNEVQDQVSSLMAAEAAPPDPKVVARPVKRTFTAAYKQQILRETDQCEKPGELGALLRRKQVDPAAKRIAELERENARLQQRLKQAEAVIALQKSFRDPGDPAEAQGPVCSPGG